jgi:surface antigen
MQSLERVPSGQPIMWDNPDNGGRYTFTPTRTYEDEGTYCREYTTKIKVGGRTQTGYGTACRQPDGQWQIVG